ncbi:MAG: hypothetical protein NZ957_00680 [Thaumarchaeota archaeon]|nr:hypothetical protein [Candidatus Calditenuaceae archaeon]MDW8041291.1 hypothetical protein [Nitrososphaerota archaeon]
MRAVLLLPLLLTSVLWIALYLFTPPPQPPVSTIPPIVTVEEPEVGPESSPAPYLNAIVLMGFIAASGTLLVLLLRLFPRIVGLLAVVAYFLVTSLSALYLVASSGVLYYVPDSVVLALIFGVAGAATFAVRRTTGLVAALSASLTGALGGIVVGSVLPPLTAIVLLGSFAAFDAIMVWRGYLAALKRPELGERVRGLRGMVVELDGATVGLGDLLFYSIAVAVAHRYLGSMAAAAVNVAVVAGYYLTILMLRRWEQVPGLTIPLTLSAVILLVLWFF